MLLLNYCTLESHECSETSFIFVFSGHRITREPIGHRKPVVFAATIVGTMDAGGFVASNKPREGRALKKKMEDAKKKTSTIGMLDHNNMSKTTSPQRRLSSRLLKTTKPQVCVSILERYARLSRGP